MSAQETERGGKDNKAYVPAAILPGCGPRRKRIRGCSTFTAFASAGFIKTFARIIPPIHSCERIALTWLVCRGSGGVKRGMQGDRDGGRLAVVGRLIAAVPFNYVLTSMVTALLARHLPMATAHASTAVTVMSYAVFAVIAMTAVTAPSSRRLWLWLGSGAATLAALLWFPIPNRADCEGIRCERIVCRPKRELAGQNGTGRPQGGLLPATGQSFLRPYGLSGHG